MTKMIKMWKGPKQRHLGWAIVIVLGLCLGLTFPVVAAIWGEEPAPPNHAPELPSQPWWDQTWGYAGVSYTFWTSAKDQDLNRVQYRFNWGDGTSISDWTSLVSSGSSAGISHTWTSAGTYDVMAQAKDEQGLPSSWSSSLPVVIVEENWVGKVVFDKQPPYPYEWTTSGDAIGIADCDAFGDRISGAVCAKAISGVAGSAWANVTQWGGLFTPTRDGPVTVEATMSLKSFVIADAAIAGVSHGETTGYVQLDSAWERMTFESQLGFDFPIPSPAQLEEILTVVDTISTLSDIFDLIAAIQSAGASLEFRAIKYTFDVQAGHTYWVGAGVGACHGSFLIAGGTAVVVGYVNEIRVLNGTAPIVEFKFNEGSGYWAMDSSGFNNNGAINNASWTSGISSGALSFNGSEDSNVYANVTEPDEDSWVTTSFEAWIKPREYKDAEITYAGDYAEYSQVRTDSNGHFEFEYHNGVFGMCTIGGSYQLNKWYHVAATVSPTTDPSRLRCSLYVNGELVSSVESRCGLFECPFYLKVGPSFNGIIDEVRAYDRILSGDEIGARYRAGPSPS